MKFSPVSLAAFVSLFAGAVCAQTNPDLEQCRNITNNPDLAIKHCTAALDSGKLSPRDRVQALLNRAVEWSAKNDYDRAIVDYDAALKIDPKLADAFHGRGTAWAHKGDPDRAIADFDTALRLNPKDAAPLLARAVEWTVKGDYQRALADYDAVQRVDPKAEDLAFSRARTLFYADQHARAVEEFEKAHKASPTEYSAIWLYLARRRAGAAGAEDRLDEATRTTQRLGWPGPVIALYLGRTDLQSVMNAATDNDPARQREQRCEASFYVAHWHLFQNAPERALPLLQEAERGCPKHLLEYEGTLAELRRLQKR
jgi:lipoprotein NlpI